MLLHLDRSQLEDLLLRARRAVTERGTLGFTVKEGDGDEWSTAKLGLPRYFTYWRAPALLAVLHATGWRVEHLDHVQGRFEPWLYVLARPGSRLRVEPHDVTGDEVTALLGAHLAQLREITAPGSKHALDLDALRDQDVTFWVARDDTGTIIGTAAVKDLGGARGEVKSMRTAPDLVHGGVGSALLNTVLAHTVEAGMTRLSLETGAGPFFTPAHRMYERHGFTLCPPFDGYVDDGNSTFYTREL